MLLDDKAEQKGGMFKLLWQFAKFCGVSVIVFLIQFGLVNGLYFLLKGWTSPLPEFLEYIFNEDVVGKGHSNWGYVVPFFSSNFIANTVGYFLNRKVTFKSDAPMWHYILYIGLLIVLIFFSTWLQGVIVNFFIQLGMEALAPTIGMSGAGLIQFIVIFPVQKFVLLKEKKKEPEEQIEVVENIEN